VTRLRHMILTKTSPLRTGSWFGVQKFLAQPCCSAAGLSGLMSCLASFAGGETLTIA
jgi:hypothetical protein